jgi:tRNA 2-thiocytidine biosynthesis protein TtcA
MMRQVIKLAGRAIHRYGMIQDGDRVLVGVSGGKDSLVLARFLAERRRRVPIEYGLVAVHLDLGYDRPEDKRALKAFLQALEVETWFEDTEYARLAHTDFNRENPCFLCARLRRRHLFQLAQRFGCRKVALGHHRDDLNVTLLMNIFYSGEISTMLPSQDFFGGALTVIRPLALVPENKIARLARSLALPVAENACPSAGMSKREEVKALIQTLTRQNKKVSGNIFHSLSNVRTDYLLDPGLYAKRPPLADPEAVVARG